MPALAIAQPRHRATRRAMVLAFPSGRFLLGAVPPDSAFADLVLPASRVSSRAGFRTADRQNILSALVSEYIPVYSPCNPNAGPSGSTIATAFGQSALKLATSPQGIATLGPAAPFVALGGAITSLFGEIFGAHAAAVGREQAALCAAIPAANQFLQQIDQAFQSGQLTAGQAASLLDEVVLQYENGVAPIVKMTSAACNAACVYLRMLQAIVAKRKAQYADRESSAPASTSVFPSASSTAGSLGNLLPWAAAAALLLLLKGGG